MKYSLSPLKGICLTAALALFLTTSCGSDDSAPQKKAADKPAATAEVTSGELPEGHPSIAPEDNAMPAGSHSNLKSARKLQLDDEVIAKWKVVNLEISDNTAGQKKAIKVNVGQKVSLKGDGLYLLVKAYVPDYALSEDAIVSRSNEPNNPAIQVELQEGDKVVSTGWIFEKLPDFNSYGDTRYGLVLLPNN